MPQPAPRWFQRLSCCSLSFARWTAIALCLLLAATTQTTAARRGAKNCTNTGNSADVKQPSLTSNPASFRVAYPFLHTLFEQYVALHADAIGRLKGADLVANPAALAAEKYVVAELSTAGWGNRLPGVFVAAALALRTNRTLLVAWQAGIAPAAVHNISLYFSSSLEFNYNPHAAKLGPLQEKARHLPCDDAAALMSLDFGIADDNPMWWLKTGDNVMPLLQVNPSMMPFFQRHFPFGEVSAPLSKLMLELAAPLASTVEAFAQRNFKDRFTIGMQMRHAKFVIVHSTYFNLAKRLAQQQGLAPDSVAYFIAADDASAYELAAGELGKDNVCWTDNGIGEVFINQDHPQWGDINPGTESSGLVDMYLLSRCDALITTRSSSFGGVAGALGYKHSYIVWGKAAGSTVQSTWVTPSLFMEPVYWSMHDFLKSGDAAHVAQFKALPGWMHHVQGHHKISNNHVDPEDMTITWG